MWVVHYKVMHVLAHTQAQISEALRLKFAVLLLKTALSKNKISLAWPNTFPPGLFKLCVIVGSYNFLSTAVTLVYSIFPFCFIKR